MFQSNLHPSTSASSDMSNCGLAAPMPHTSYGAAARSAIMTGSLWALGHVAPQNSMRSLVVWANGLAGGT